MSKFIMMVGLPASGKSYYAREIAIKEDAIIMSSDSLRQELYDNEDTQDHNTELFVELHRRIKDALREDISVVYDATNTSYKKRKAFLDELKKIPCEKECYLIATPFEKCIEQNNKRDRKVPENVIERMYKQIFIPQYYEGWDKIHIIKNFNHKDFDINVLFNGENGLNKIDQENPHHTLTIGNHCRKCASNVEILGGNDLLIASALFHDIGKSFTKEFKNGKGEATEIAHYFNHNNVSAYLSLFYLTYEKEDVLKITNYIQWHMELFFIDSEKAKTKFINLVGKEFYNDLLILHKADKTAK
jgi:predicted kinase